ncbi:glutathione S-transferase family protein [Aurantiacibacter spongiae]|uniref:Glutathione S-transferase family protein n=1 Tax=Aurantiacibacter spongiae TaxID=2488860 RepID=A0A3N5CXJ1_9SPHN|nr:glutathione S-transferase family protein [Aurantiacibacter spongiae]RPF72320.1 glutathione S-transferase family protein [Aurantiacibacter spongiae]
MAGPLVIHTLDWVPEGPRGYVRDLRLRWACEEAGRAYRIAGVGFEHRATNHLGDQPFGQVPFIEDGDVRMFESGACLLHIARDCDRLLPGDPQGRATAISWIFAALNSVEVVTMPWWFIGLSRPETNPLDDLVDQRLAAMERVLKDREWLAAGRFTAADLLMADVLRIPALRGRGDRPATRDYVARVTGRPAFARAHRDQLDHFAHAEKARSLNEGV